MHLKLLRKMKGRPKLNYNQTYWRENKDRLKEKRKNLKLTNPDLYERNLQKSRDWKIKNTEKVKEYVKKHKPIRRLTNKRWRDRIPGEKPDVYARRMKYSREWYNKNKEYYLAKQAETASDKAKKDKERARLRRLVEAVEVWKIVDKFAKLIRIKKYANEQISVNRKATYSKVANIIRAQWAKEEIFVMKKAA